jgi:DNA-binding NtrC family response regulator
LEAPERLSGNEQVSGRPTVLIIDDEAGIRKLLTTVLNENGYDAESAENGAEAINKTSEKRYDIALIDIILPDLNGVQLLTKFKETRPRTRKIIMTGNPSLQNAVEALNSGADAYIMKPFEMQKVLETVKDQLDKQEQERQAMDQLVERGRLRARMEQFRH